MHTRRKVKNGTVGMLVYHDQSYQVTWLRIDVLSNSHQGEGGKGQ